MKYCEFCGTALEDNVVCSCDQAIKARSKSDKLKKTLCWIIIPVAVIAIIAAVVSAILIFGNRTDPFDYITVSFDGLNGNGRIVVDIDKKEMADLVYGETKDPESLEDISHMIELDERKTDLANDILCIIDKEDGLSNGDIVTVTITCGELASKHFKSVSKTFTAEGLVELEKIDAFANLEVSFKGASGDATIDIRNNSNDVFLRNIRYSADIISNISNGQNITITAEYDEEFAIECGVIPISDTKVISVSGLSEYVRNAEQLPQDELKTVIQFFIDKEEYGVNDSMISYDKPYFYAAYFQTETAKNSTLYANVLTIFIAQDVYTYGDYLRTNYRIVTFRNILVNTDGMIRLDPTSADQTTFTTNVEASIQKLMDDKSYSTTKVNVE